MEFGVWRNGASPYPTLRPGCEKQGSRIIAAAPRLLARAEAGPARDSSRDYRRSIRAEMRSGSTGGLKRYP